MFISATTAQFTRTNTYINNNNRSNVTQHSFMGWQPKKTEDKITMKQMAEIIKGNDINTIAVSGHVLPDGDSISSCIACASLLHESTGKNVDVYIFDKMQDRFKFLLNYAKGINIIEVNSDTPMDKKYDLCVSVDTSAPNLINEDYYNNIFKQAKHSLKIDHHPAKLPTASDNTIITNYADINFTDTNCTSGSEVLMQLVKPLGLNPSKLPKTFTDAVYSGMLSDSAGYKFVDNPIVFNDAALLLSKGVNHKKLSKAIFEKKELPQSITELNNILKTKTQFSENGKIGYIVIDDEVDEYIKKAEDDTDKVTVNDTIKKIIGQLREKNNVEVAFYTRIIKGKNGKDEIAVSLRSNEVPVNEVAVKFGGGGHKNAAGLYGDAQGKTSKQWADEFLNELEVLTNK